MSHAVTRFYEVVRNEKILLAVVNKFVGRQTEVELASRCFSHSSGGKGRE